MTIVAGAAGGGYWFHQWGAALVGMLLGLVVGLEIVRSLASKTDAPAVLSDVGLSPGWIPWLSRVAWAGIAFSWLWAFQAGWIQGEGGGLILVLFMIPLTAFFWLIGGPLVADTSKRTLERIAAGKYPPSDSELAHRGLVQSRIMTVAFLLLLLWILSQMFV